MSRTDVSLQALNDQKNFYDARFKEGYMTGFSDLYEACRLYTIKEVLNKIKKTEFTPKAILDYGCGEGRYVNVLSKFFPDALIFGGDISDVGLKIAKENNPDAKFINMFDERVDIKEGSIDLVVSVEVLEHVKNVENAVKEICRVLRPGGMLVLTVPCANKYSLEWFFNKLTGGLQPSFDSYGRFATDEPAHLRRLNDGYIKSLFSKYGVGIDKIYHRAHFFTTLMNWIKIIRIIPMALRVQLALLDWYLFKHLPNGASLLAVGRKGYLNV